MPVVPPPPLCGEGGVVNINIPVGGTARVVDDGFNTGTGTICAEGTVAGYNALTQKLGTPTAIRLDPGATIPVSPMGSPGDPSVNNQWFFRVNLIPNVVHSTAPGQGNKIVVWVPVQLKTTGALVCMARGVFSPINGVSSLANDCARKRRPRKKKKHHPPRKA